MKGKISSVHIFWLASLIALMGFQYHYRYGEEPVEKESKLHRGDLAPQFILPDRDGKDVSLDQLHTDKPVLIAFFSTNCPPCRMEVRQLTRRRKEFKEQSKDKGFPFNIVLITFDDIEQIEALETKEGAIEFPILFDKLGKSAEDYGVDAIPHTVFVSKKGKVLFVEQGYSPMLWMQIEDIMHEDDQSNTPEFD